MKEINIGAAGFVYENINELSDIDKNLMEAAIEATKKSYAPYSGFKVGAALLMEDDSIITGNNQENAAYPSGMCAECVAIWKVASEYPTIKILKLPRKLDRPLSDGVENLFGNAL